MCVCVCEAGVRLPLTHTHTCVNTHTPSLEQHVVHPESRARLMVARILLAWWYRLLVSAEDVGEKKKKHPVCSHTGSVAYNSNLMHQSLLPEQQSVSRCINCRAHMVITKKASQSQQEITTYSHFSLLTVFSYKWFASSFLFSPQFLLLASSLVFILSCSVKPLLWVNPRFTPLTAMTAVPAAALVATLAFLRGWCKLLLSLFLRLSLSVYLCPLHTSLFLPSI